MFIYAAKLSKDFRIQGFSDNIFQQDIHNLMFTKYIFQTYVPLLSFSVAISLYTEHHQNSCILMNIQSSFIEKQL